MSANEPRSVLVADCGASNTNVVMFDVVHGAYRFIAKASAPTTRTPPWSNVLSGVRHAVTRISDITGRPLLDDNGHLITPARPNGQGVDRFAVTSSAAEPLRCLVVGLLDDVSLRSARRAIRQSYAYEIDCFSLSDARNEQQQMQAIARLKPDVILIAGGTDGGADLRVLRLAETVGLGLNMLAHGERPRVIFAGNTALREQVTETLGGVASLFMADNVRPRLSVERLDDVVRIINEMYEDTRLGTIPGADELNIWSRRPMQPTANAFTTIVEYFASLGESGVLGVDVGSNSVTLVAADAERSRRIVRSDLGLGEPIANLLAMRPAAEIGRWLPVRLEPAAVADYVYQKGLRPQFIPATSDELHLEHAAARAVLRQTLLDWRGPEAAPPPVRLILARGGVLANAPRPGQALLMLLDALQPTGIFSVALDRHGILPALGALARTHPLLVVQALEGGVLDDLGWVVAPTGTMESGQKVVSATMSSERGGQLELEVAAGTLEVLPLPPGNAATLTLEPARGIDIGFGPGQKQSVEVHGGAVGVVIDARGRPLTQPDTPDTMRQWLWDVGG